MALPFYNVGDQAIYEGGEHFIPQERYRLGYTAPPSIANAQTTSGITNTQAANPYIYPPQGGGGGGGANAYGLDLSNTKMFNKNVYDASTGTWNMEPIKGYYTPSGYKTAQGKNIEHAGLFTGDPKEGDIEETEMDFSKLRNLSPINFITTKLRNWRENRDIKKAATEQEEKTASGVGPTTGQGGAIESGDLRDIGGGFHEYKDSGTAASYEGSHAQGGRSGLYAGGDPEEPAEDIYELMRDQNIPFDEQVEAGPTEEQVAMVIDMDGRGMEIEDIMSVTELGRDAILNILGIEMAQGGLASLV